MRFKLFLFSIGLFLLVVSSITGAPVLKEHLYRWEMVNKYNIKEINADYKGASKTYDFEGMTISTSHTLTGEKPYLNGWDQLVYPADIAISIDGEVAEVLEGYPVKLSEGEYEMAVDGLNQYTHYLSYWLVENQRSKKKFFAITLQLNGYDTKSITDGIMEGEVDQEEFEYQLISVQEDGTIQKEGFTYQDKNKLQTQLISPMYSGPPGYYTEVLNPYYITEVPFLYPYLTSLIGIILTIGFFPYRLLKRRKPIAHSTEKREPETSD